MTDALVLYLEEECVILNTETNKKLGKLLGLDP